MEWSSTEADSITLRKYEIVCVHAERLEEKGNLNAKADLNNGVSCESNCVSLSLKASVFFLCEATMFNETACYQFAVRPTPI
jgi:hypothetical protein